MEFDPVCQQILINYAQTDGDMKNWLWFHRLIDLRHKQFVKDPSCIEEQKPLIGVKSGKELPLTFPDFAKQEQPAEEPAPETPEQVAQDVGNDVQPVRFVAKTPSRRGKAK